MINELLDKLIKEITKIEDVDAKIQAINDVRAKLSQVSPFKEPIDNVQWVKVSDIQANEYNPNQVATPEMKLLYESIRLDGYTQPVVTFKLKEGREIVDGFHRNRILKEHKDIYDRCYGYLPVTTIEKSIDERMGSTIRHNRARGTHQIRSMSEIVIELSKQGWNDVSICNKLGMELDEVIRLKQVSGLKEVFKGHEFSNSWVAFHNKYYKEDHHDK